MNAIPEIVAVGTGLGEGPVWCPDGTLVLTSVDRGLLLRVRPESGVVETIADTAGSPNGACLASDGGFLVTQAGGHDLSSFSPLGAGAGRLVLAEPPPPLRPTTPGLQRVDPTGMVSRLPLDGFRAPNDLVVASDGTVYFTDPPELHSGADERNRLMGRVWSYDTDGRLSTVGTEFWYCNGIALDPDEVLLVVERGGIVRLFPDGSCEWVIESLAAGAGAGDGICLDADGRVYAPVNPERVVKVVEDGRVVDHLVVPEGPPGVVTNCCFGGDDLRTLYVTDVFQGRVLAWESMPTAGMPLTPWPVAPDGLAS